MNKLSARQKQAQKISSTRGKLPQSLSAKPINQLQMIAKFKQDLQRRKEVIQKLYQKSVPNQIYSFPRHNYFFDERDPDNESTSNQSSLSDIEPNYDLKKQNKKNKKGQTTSNILFSTDLKILCKTQSNYQSINTAEFKNLNQGSAKKTNKKKIQSNYQSRNPKIQKTDKEKTKDKNSLFESSKKMFIGQHSLGKSVNASTIMQKNHSSTKPKDSKIHINFRIPENIQKEQRSLKIKKNKSKDKAKDESLILESGVGLHTSQNFNKQTRHVRANTEHY